MNTCKFTSKQLWAFVNRADTLDKIQIASDFLTKLDGLSIELYNDLMIALSFKSREILNPKW